MKKLRFGVIGAGGIGFHHMAAVKSCPRAELVAIAENNAQRCAQAAQQHGVSATYSKYKQLLDRADIDAVSIALPNYLHAPVAIAALRAGKHVHLEKPMAMSVREAQNVIAAARKARRVFMVGQNWRFMRDSQTLRALVQRGV